VITIRTFFEKMSKVLELDKRATMIDFENIPWVKVTGKGRVGRVKQKILADSSTIRVLEFSPKWNETVWCKRSHIGYVLSGQLNLDFKLSKESILVDKGQAFAISKNYPHKASCKSVTKVFIVG
jgi:quercetin dioxygenase-like cupin family protein